MFKDAGWPGQRMTDSMKGSTGWNRCRAARFSEAVAAAVAAAAATAGGASGGRGGPGRGGGGSRRKDTRSGPLHMHEQGGGSKGRDLSRGSAGAGSALAQGVQGVH